ncbi:DELTA-stichotoxin-Hcr4a-like [Brachyhypopomus gauderio]|uniref:DELTA-stichotoxin-Hcr4a-like n=1 Tax=Brachyhypopomus gauderio TaxID=698409 RepID=UPI004042F136
MTNVSAAILAGASLAGLSIEKISRSINTDRNIVIEITNYSDTYILENPRVHTSSGYCLNPPQPTIQKKTKEACSFTRSSDIARGAVGVLTYQILTDEMHCVGELAIMFSVPFDYNLYQNWFALGIFNHGISCNNDLFNQMYYDAPSKLSKFTRGKATGTGITFSAGDLTIKGTMSPARSSVMKVEFREG